MADTPVVEDVLARMYGRTTLLTIDPVAAPTEMLSMPTDLAQSGMRVAQLQFELETAKLNEDRAWASLSQEKRAAAAAKSLKLTEKAIEEMVALDPDYQAVQDLVTRKRLVYNQAQEIHRALRVKVDMLINIEATTRAQSRTGAF